MGSTEYKTCPFCDKRIKKDAIKCKICQSMLVQSSADNNIYIYKDDFLQDSKTHNDLQHQGNKSGNNKIYPKISIALGIVGAALLAVPILSFISTGSGLFFGVKSLKSPKKSLAIVGIVICSLFLFSSSILMFSQLIESTNMRVLRSQESSLNAQINELRNERLSLERERSNIQRLINEHERIYSKSSISDNDKSRLLDISSELMRHSRYINYRIDSSGILISPTINKDLDERIKEIRLQELTLERELAPLELQNIIDGLD